MRGHAGAVAIVSLALAACGIRGTPPVPKDPSPVSDLRVEGRDGGVRVSWRGRTSGITRFDVLRRLESEERVFFEKIGEVGRAGNRRYYFQDRALTEGARYVYRVRALRTEPETRELRYSGPQGAFTWELAPEPPTGVKSAPLNAGARLSWDPVPGADGFRVYELNPDRSAKPEPANRGLIDKTTWVAVALADGKSICYVVRAVKLPPRLAEAREANAMIDPSDHVEAPTGAEVVDAASTGLVIPRGNPGRQIREAVSELAGEGPLPGVESPSSEETCVTPGLTELPAPPKRPRAEITREGMALSWKKSTAEEAIGYHVERMEVGPDGTPKSEWVRLTTEVVTAVGWIDRSAKKGVRYRYQIRTVDSSGAEGPPSTPTDPKPFTP